MSGKTVNYADARIRFHSGDLLAWSHRGFSSFYDLQIQAVRFFTRSEYCHVGLTWQIAERVFVLEAVSAGVRIFPLSRLRPFFWLPIGVRWDDDLEAFALSKVGARYSKWQAVLAGLGILKSGQDEIWQCAEYVQAVYREAGIAWVKGIQPTPSNLVATAQGSGEALYLIT